MPKTRVLTVEDCRRSSAIDQVQRAFSSFPLTSASVFVRRWNSRCHGRRTETMPIEVPWIRSSVVMNLGFVASVDVRHRRRSPPRRRSFDCEKSFVAQARVGPIHTLLWISTPWVFRIRFAGMSRKTHVSGQSRHLSRSYLGIFNGLTDGNKATLHRVLVHIVRVFLFVPIPRQNNNTSE